MSSFNSDLIPKFFRLRQEFERSRLDDVGARVQSELARILPANLSELSVAVTVGSRGIANIDTVTLHCVDVLKARGAAPFIVPAMGSHGGATADGQTQVLASLGVTETAMGCPIRSSMEVVEVCQAAEGFPVYFDRFAFEADRVLVVNRIKPHTRFAGAIESGLMKMMLIGLGKQKGAEVYHQVIHNYSFDQIVRSVAKEVIAKCSIVGGLAILENAYEETGAIFAAEATEIESREAEFLETVKCWMPKLPFEKSELLVIDQIGKNISGTGMDTNVIGRKKNDHAAIEGEKPDIHHIYVRGLTDATHGNASGIGLSELCHRQVIESMNQQATRMNCITAGHITGGMLPVDFESDFAALKTACQLSGYVPPQEVTAMWIQDTLHLAEIECSEAFLSQARERGLEILCPPSPLEFDSHGNLLPRFP
ncbi:MAG: lactate racemase domain-containing protein [Planctomycetota bacterium]|nr:lactate racemase domain-containing protein [Planctomycetota bacterium]